MEIALSPVLWAMFEGRVDMSALETPFAEGKQLTPCPKPGVNRKELREKLSTQYEHTLRRLGR